MGGEMSITPSLRGRVPILYVRARANDRPRFSLPTWLEVNALATELQSYWRDNSQGALHVVSVVVPEEIVLPDSAATSADEKLTPRSKIAAEIRSVLTSPTGLGWDQSDLDRYYGVVGIVNCRSDGGAIGESGDVVL